MRDKSVAAKITSYRDAAYYAKKRGPKGIAAAYGLAGQPNATAEWNERAFREILFEPRAGVSAHQQDLTTSVAGFKLDLPIILSSVGGLRGLHQDGELAATRTAAKFGGMQFLSALTTTPVEDVMREAKGPVFQQVYYIDSRDATASLLDRAAAAGVHGMVVCVDSPARGVGGETLPNERPYLPQKVGAWEALRFLPQLWNRPSWAFNFLRNGLKVPSAQYALDEHGKPRHSLDATSRIYNESPTFEDLPWIREHWNGPLVIKGISRPDDARRAVDAGADAIVVSNHGGFMLDSSAPTIRLLPSIVEAVGDQVDVLIDGGIRSGSDVVKALALGAKAVGIGRAYAYSLMAAGEPGVHQMVSILRQQTIDALRFLGVNSAAEIDPSFLSLPPSWARLRLDELEAASSKLQLRL